MMGIVAPNGVDPEILARFRQQARGHVPAGDSPGHADGWGIVHYDERHRPAYAGRSTEDAATDPLYPQAIDELRKRRPKGALLAHVRKASAGARSVENSHPFVRGKWAFCHNGTVFGPAEDKARGGEAAGPRSGRAGVWGLAPEGESDSREAFAILHDDIIRGATPREALHTLVERVERLKFTSMTCLLTDGETLWGVRKVGNVDEECRDNACSPDHYTLGVARIGDQTVVSQEHEFLGVDQWRVVPDGHVVVVAPSGHPQIVAI